MIKRDQYTTNGLLFMPTPGYRHYFYFILFIQHGIEHKWKNQTRILMMFVFI